MLRLESDIIPLFRLRWSRNTQQQLMKGIRERYVTLTCMYVHTLTLTCTYVHTLTHTYAHMHVHFMYTHTHMHTQRLIGTMYSDEVSDYGSRTGLTPTKQPRVVLLPGEGQDISPPSRSSQPRVVLLPGEGQDISPPSRSSQPRVVLLPGEGQDISPPSRSSHATTDRSRRLLEAAGELIEGHVAT